MNRLWIGLGILLALLLAGLWTTERMEQIHSEISDSLTQTAQVLEKQDWQQADGAISKAREQWERSWKFTSAIADHTTLDEIDGVFAELEVYRRLRKRDLCAATCARLAEQIKALADAYSLNWWNVL